MNIAAAKNQKYFIQNKTCPLAGKWALVAERHLAIGTIWHQQERRHFWKTPMEQLAWWMKKSKPREVLQNRAGRRWQVDGVTCGQWLRQTEIQKVNLEDTTTHRDTLAFLVIIYQMEIRSGKIDCWSSKDLQSLFLKASFQTLLIRARKLIYTANTESLPCFPTKTMDKVK